MSITDFVKRLFNPNKPKQKVEDRFKNAPSDDVGKYIELTGVVVAVGESYFEPDPRFEPEQIGVDVKMDNGVVYHAFTTSPPKVGYKATVRHYQWGGGWYPDDKVVAWSEE